VLAVLAVLGVLGTTGTTGAAGAATTRYAGKTHDRGAVSFRLSGRVISRYQAAVSVLCISVAPARSTRVTYVVAPRSVARTSPAGSFAFSFKRPKEQFTLPGKGIVQTLYSVTARVQGKVRGRAASGSVKVNYNTFWLAYNPATGFSLLTLASCFGKTTWTAKRR